LEGALSLLSRVGKIRDPDLLSGIARILAKIDHNTAKPPPEDFNLASERTALRTAVLVV
jgi:hypothetical protein